MQVTVTAKQKTESQPKDRRCAPSLKHLWHPAEAVEEYSMNCAPQTLLRFFMRDTARRFCPPPSGLALGSPVFAGFAETTRPIETHRDDETTRVSTRRDFTQPSVRSPQQGSARVVNGLLSSCFFSKPLGWVFLWIY